MGNDSYFKHGCCVVMMNSQVATFLYFM